jgi:hypothetical protein
MLLLFMQYREVSGHLRGAQLATVYGTAVAVDVHRRLDIFRDFRIQWREVYSTEMTKFTFYDFSSIKKLTCLLATRGSIRNIRKQDDLKVTKLAISIEYTKYLDSNVTNHDIQGV